MKWPQISLGALLIWFTALPIWIFLIVVIPGSPGWGGNPFGLVAAPLVLVGVAAAIHVLLRSQRNGWPLSILLAPIVVFAALSIIASLVAN